MKSLIGILNRIILAFGILFFYMPVFFYGGMDYAPKPVKVLSFLLSIGWFGMYAYGYQKIFKKLMVKKLKGSNKTLNTIHQSKDIKPMHRLETSGEAHIPLEDINRAGNRETFELRIKIFIIIAILALIYFTKVMNKTL